MRSPSCTSTSSATRPAACSTASPPARCASTTSPRWHYPAIHQLRVGVVAVGGTSVRYACGLFDGPRCVGLAEADRRALPRRGPGAGPAPGGVHPPDVRSSPRPLRSRRRPRRASRPAPARWYPGRRPRSRSSRTVVAKPAAPRPAPWPGRSGRWRSRRRRRRSRRGPRASRQPRRRRLGTLEPGVRGRVLALVEHRLDARDVQVGVEVDARVPTRSAQASVST